MRVAPDLFGLLRMQGLERDRVHRRDRGELDETLDVDVMKLRGNSRERVEPRATRSCDVRSERVSSVTSRIFVAASDGPPMTHVAPTGARHETGAEVVTP